VDQGNCREFHRAYISGSVALITKIKRCNEGKHFTEQELSREYHYKGAVQINWKKKTGELYGVGDLVIELCDGKLRKTIEDVEINLKPWAV